MTIQTQILKFKIWIWRYKINDYMVRMFLGICLMVFMKKDVLV